MNKNTNKRRDIITFLVPFFAVLALQILNVKVPAWVYVEHLLLMLYGFSPEWLTNIIELGVGWLSIHLYIIYVYIRNVFYVFKQPTKK